MARERGSVLLIQSYAQALFSAGRKLGVVQRLLEESRMLGTLLAQQPNFRHFLEQPQLSKEVKRALIDKAFKDKLNPILMNLLAMMVDRERAILLPSILEKFQEVAERFEGIYPATIISARELGFQEKLRLKTALEKHTGVHLRIRHQVHPEILGGIIFRFKDTLVDGSVRNGLKEIRKRFEARHEAA